jgi:hypothetical protein
MFLYTTHFGLEVHSVHIEDDLWHLVVFRRIGKILKMKFFCEFEVNVADEWDSIENFRKAKYEAETWALENGDRV